MLNKVVYSRTFKPIPNAFIQMLFGTRAHEGLDGELIVGPPNAPDVYRETVKGVMSRDGNPQATFMVFDNYTVDRPYMDRLAHLRMNMRGYCEQTALVEGEGIDNEKQLLKFEQSCLKKGYEGLIIRDMFGKYKFGRSTFKEFGMVKLKRFTDGEAEVLGCVEQQHNANEARMDEQGRMKRSSHKQGKELAGVLGAFKVRDVKTGIEFEIGAGLTAQERAELWKGRGQQIGRLVKYKSFTIGVKDKPRHPVFLGFRSKEDM